MKRAHGTYVFLLCVTMISFAARAGNEKTLPQLPDAMLGVWGWSAQSCATKGDDGRVTVSPRSVAFFASRYNFTEIFPQPDGSIIARAGTHEEGEAKLGRGAVRLKLAGQNRLTHAPATLTHDSSRCAR